MHNRLRPGRPLPIALAALVLPMAAACSVGDIDVLGGRTTCWPEGEPRIASLMKGTVVIDAAGARLDTPEGEVLILLAPPGGQVRPDLAPPTILDAQGGNVVNDGDRATLFGGLGADASMVVCGIESMTED